MNARTSLSDPIHVNWLPQTGAPGRVGLTMAPGKHAFSKHGAPWARDLAVDLAQLRHGEHADVLVCLLQQDEMQRLRIPTLLDAARALGLAVHHFPIRDGGVPPRSHAVAPLVRAILDHTRGGERVVVHCQGGLGRAGTIGGCYLRACGVDADEALAILQRTRGPNCPENGAQRDFIRRFAP